MARIDGNVVLNQFGLQVILWQILKQTQASV